jgi:hypothetical protein
MSCTGKDWLMLDAASKNRNANAGAGSNPAALN